MPLAESIDDQLRSFLIASRFAHEGAVITDLDGTAVHEVEGRVAIPHTVSHGLKHLNDLGRPVILNTLRFPLNVIRTFGREWHAITNAPLPLVSLNGAVIGHLTSADHGVTFEEVAAFPLARSDIEELLTGVQGLVDGGVHELVLFYYPRNWMMGELIWTPAPERLKELRAKYLSATEITSSTFDQLRQFDFARFMAL
jgi:hydroxymethylpyrimidine pyrophosphatase-like HAD family hydrolase